MLLGVQTDPVGHLDYVWPANGGASGRRHGFLGLRTALLQATTGAPGLFCSALYADAHAALTQKLIFPLESVRLYALHPRKFRILHLNQVTFLKFTNQVYKKYQHSCLQISLF
jgi:hypothetical protein